MDRNVLYYATCVWLALTVLVGIFFLSKTMLPSADVVNAARSTVYTLNVQDIAPGQAKTFKLGGAHVVVWRRDDKQKVQSLKLLGVDVHADPNLLEFIRTKGEIEFAPGRFFGFEWFVVSPINVGGYGCIVLANAGEYGGFFDPCQNVHFDLWGRVMKGPTEADLQALPWSLSEDRTSIAIDVGGAPRRD